MVFLFNALGILVVCALVGYGANALVNRVQQKPSKGSRKTRTGSGDDVVEMSTSDSE